MAGNVHGGWSFLIVSASLVGYLFSVSFFSSFHDPTPAAHVRQLVDDGRERRVRRRILEAGIARARDPAVEQRAVEEDAPCLRAAVDPGRQVVAPLDLDAPLQRVHPGAREALDGGREDFPARLRLCRRQRAIDRLQPGRCLGRSDAGQQAERRRSQPARGVHKARIAWASCMSLACCALAFRSRRNFSAASSCAPRMRPSVATKLAASSRACSTTLSLGDVVLDEADVPTAEAEVPAVALPAKAGAATEQAKRPEIKAIRVFMAAASRMYRPHHTIVGARRPVQALVLANQLRGCSWPGLRAAGVQRGSCAVIGGQQGHSSRSWIAHAAARSQLENPVRELDVALQTLDELSAEIRQLLKTEPRVRGYRMPRVSFYLGRWMRTTDMYPDYQLRLYDRRHAEWDGLYVHESVKVKTGPAGYLNGELQHYPYKDLSEHLIRMDHYTTLAARQMFEKGKRATRLELLFHPPIAFARSRGQGLVGGSLAGV